MTDIQAIKRKIYQVLHDLHPSEDVDRKHIRIGRRREKTLEDRYGYEDDSNKFVLSKPTLLCLSGRDASTNDIANGYAKLGQLLLGCSEVYDSKIQVLGATYPLEETSTQWLINKHNQAADAGRDVENYTDTAYHLAYQQFFPLVAKVEIRDDKLFFERLPADQAIRNCRNVNVLAYSYGGVVISEVGNALCEFMEAIGYSVTEIEDITRQIMVLNAAPVQHIGTGKANFTKVNLLNIGDEHVKMRCKNIAKVNNILESSGKKDTPLVVVPTHESRATEYTLCANPGIPNQIRTHSTQGFVYKENEEVKLQPVFKDPKGHAANTYFFPGLGAHGFMLPLAAASVLVNSVNNSISNAANATGEFEPLPPPLKLLEMPKQVAYTQATSEEIGIYASLLQLADNIEYNRRINAAWQR